MLKKFLEASIINAVKISGSYHPDENMYLIEEQFTSDEADDVRDFLQFVYNNNLTFGTGNIQEVYGDYKSRSEMLADVEVEIRQGTYEI